MLIRTSAILFAALTVLATPASAHQFKAGNLLIDHPWIPATPKGASTAAGYTKITNNGETPDRLIGGSAEGAKMLEVHEMKVENNIMKMRKVAAGLPIKPGETLELTPSSYHLMIMGLKGPYEKGSMVKGTLVFEKAGTVDVTFKVEGMAGMPDGQMNHGDMGDHKAHQ